MKKIIVTGNVGRDPEVRHAPSGESFVTFSFAVTTGSKNNQKTDWLEISCNGKTAEVVQNYVRKGSKLLVEGTPSAHAYINKEGKPVATLKVNALSIEFIGSKQDNSPTEDSYAEPTNQYSTPQNSGFNAPGVSFQPEDIPF